MNPPLREAEYLIFWQIAKGAQQVRIEHILAAIPSWWGQWIPNPRKPKTKKIFNITGGELGDPVILQCQGQANVVNAPESKIILCGNLPELVM